MFHNKPQKFFVQLLGFITAMVVSFYVRIIVYVGITLPAIPSVRIAKSRQFSMDAMNKERGAALTCREGDEENIQF